MGFGLLPPNQKKSFPKKKEAVTIAALHAACFAESRRENQRLHAAGEHADGEGPPPLQDGLSPLRSAAFGTGTGQTCAGPIRPVSSLDEHGMEHETPGPPSVARMSCQTPRQRPFSGSTNSPPPSESDGPGPLGTGQIYSILHTELQHLPAGSRSCRHPAREFRGADGKTGSEASN